ncbi:zf-TFIIB domain-containing protein [Paraburkholderia sp. B3]|uniref:TFIIB-type zinc ribbon-containing protein n=1 Tax=Paraburkholderia sp. B3 TaxID=3134791 RepID=UPI003982025F
MKCPQCPDATLTFADRQGVEIDYCPQCRGVWLDRGELDKLIDRTTPPRRADDGYGGHAGGSPRHAYDRHDSHGRRRKSWLGDLFD